MFSKIYKTVKSSMLIEPQVKISTSTSAKTDTHQIFFLGGGQKAEAN